MNFGSSCMSWRQPSANMETTAAIATTPRRAVCFTCVLMIHLHHGDRGELLKERPCLDKRKHGINCLQTKEELVRCRTGSKVGCVEERMIELRQSIQRQHPEARRKSGKQNGQSFAGKVKRRPGKNGSAATIRG